MKRVFFCFFCLLFLFGCFLSVPAFSDNGDITVYVTRTGYAYHRDGCYHLKSRIPMSLRAAVESGHSPCKDCNPPLPDFTVSVSTAPARSLSSERYSARSSSSVVQPVFDWLKYKASQIPDIWDNLPEFLQIVLCLLLIPLSIAAYIAFYLLMVCIYGFFSRLFQRFRK